MQVSIKMQNLFPLNSFFLNYESVSSTLKKRGEKRRKTGINHFKKEYSITKSNTETTGSNIIEIC